MTGRFAAFLITATLATSAPTPTLAAAPLHDAALTPLRDAAHRAALQREPSSTTQGAGAQATAPVAAQSTDEDRAWVVRHPALTGALLGAAIGVPIGIATCATPSAEHGGCSTYTYVDQARGAGAVYVGGIGAGLGALVGFVASKLHN